MIGSDSVSAFCMSFSKTPLSSLLGAGIAELGDAELGVGLLEAFVAARIGSTRSLVTMSLPGTSNMTFTVCRSGEIR